MDNKGKFKSYWLLEDPYQLTVHTKAVWNNTASKMYLKFFQQNKQKQIYEDGH